MHNSFYKPKIIFLICEILVIINCEVYITELRITDYDKSGENKLAIDLCDLSSKVDISHRVLDDLNIFHMFQICFEMNNRKNNDEIEDFLFSYLTYDADEIKRRNEIISYLVLKPDAESLIKKIINERSLLHSSLDKLNKTNRPLITYNLALKALKSYIVTVDTMNILFSQEDCSKPNAAAITRFINSIKESAFYLDIKDKIKESEKHVVRLDNVTLAVNVLTDGQAEQIAVTGINCEPENVDGLFGSKERANSLSNVIKVKSRNEIVNLELYIIDKVEKLWSAPLNKILREYKKIDFNILNEWCNWIEHMVLFQKGVYIAKQMILNNCKLSRPIISDGEINAEKMLYPDLVLAGFTSVPQDINIKKGVTTIITGANSSGKTSALKSIAQNYLLAQLGFLVPAYKFIFIPYTKWFSVFSPGEDKDMHFSRFQQEAVIMNTVLAEVTPGSIIFLNEPFTSTNPHEAIKLLHDIIVKLNKMCITIIIVTHLFDLYYSLREHTKISSYVTGTAQKDNKMVYTFNLEKREPDGYSYAKHVAEEYGFTYTNIIKDKKEIEIYKNIDWGKSDGHIIQQ